MSLWEPVVLNLGNCVAMNDTYFSSVITNQSYSGQQDYFSSNEIKISFNLPKMPWHSFPHRSFNASLNLWSLKALFISVIRHKWHNKSIATTDAYQMRWGKITIFYTPKKILHFKMRLPENISCSNWREKSETQNKQRI